MEHTFLELKHIGKKYGNFTALSDINLQVQKGEFVCLLGPSGCGKTTLLRIIAGLEKPSAGEVYINGKDATDLKIDSNKIGNYDSIESEIADVFIVLNSICTALDINLFDAIYNKERINEDRKWN